MALNIRPSEKSQAEQRRAMQTVAGLLKSATTETSGERAANIQAAAVNYDAAVAANWPGGVDPGEVDDALDTLASSMATTLDFFNGTFVESFDAKITYDSGNIVCTVSNPGSGTDLTERWSDGTTTFDVTANGTINLTEGASDAAPDSRYVYILQSDKQTLVEGAAWPTAEHIKIAYFLVPLATWVNTHGGVYVNQNWNDHAADNNDLGHLAHMTHRMRSQGAIWLSGCAGTATVDGAESPDAIWVAVASGSVMQMHPHAIGTMNSDPNPVSGPSSDDILVVNDNSAAYTVITDLATITADSQGNAIIAQQHFNVVLWVVANKTGEHTQMMINLPSDTYTKLDDAILDIGGFDDFSIPAEFNLKSSTGFLVARFTLKAGVTNYTVEATQDLRGFTPSTARSGGSSGAGNVTADANLTDETLIRGDGGISGVKTTGIAVDGLDNVSAMGTLGCGQITSTGSIDAFADIDTTGAEAPAQNDVLKWNGNTWVPGTAGDTSEFTFSIASFTDNESSTQLIGGPAVAVWETAGSITFGATYLNGPPTVATVTVSSDDGSYTPWSTNPMELDSPYTSQVTDENTNYPTAKDKYVRFTLNTTPTDSATATVTFRNYIYWGETSTQNSFSEANVEALSGSAVSNDQTISQAITAGGGEYVAIAFPASYTSIPVGTDYETDGNAGTGFRFNGITCAVAEDTTTLSITNSAGYVENYKVYVSTTANMGASTLVTYTSAQALNNVHYGISTSTTGWSSANVLAFAKSEITNDNTQLWDSNSTAGGEYHVWAFPKRLGTPTFKDNATGLEIGMQGTSPETVSVTNVCGWTEDYYVWCTEFAALGALRAITS